MSHFAQLDANNRVIQVLVGNNEEPDEGMSWLIENFGGRWIKTSYNGNIRKNFAGLGYYYDDALDAFIPPKPFESWVLDEVTCIWNPPIPYPADGGMYAWNEDSRAWDELQAPA